MRKEHDEIERRQSAASYASILSGYVGNSGLCREDVRCVRTARHEYQLRAFDTSDAVKMLVNDLRTAACDRTS